MHDMLNKMRLLVKARDICERKEAKRTKNLQYHTGILIDYNPMEKNISQHHIYASKF